MPHKVMSMLFFDTRVPSLDMIKLVALSCLHSSDNSDIFNKITTT